MKNVIRRKPLYFLPLVLSLFSSACNEATFTGNNPSRALNEAPAEVFCEFSNATLPIGEKTRLHIRFQGKRPDKIFQSLTVNGLTSESELVASDGEIPAQEINGAVAGKIEVALYLVQGSDEPVASCLAQVEEPQNVAKPSLTCSIAPKAIELGTTARVSVKANAIDGPLYQTVVIGGETIGSQKELSPSDDYASTVLASAEGSMRIELRSSDAGKVLAHCEATVITTAVCEDTEESIGAHIAILIDNSNSNAATDCPAAVKIGKHNNVDLFECGQTTNREKAVEAAFGLLQSLREKEPDNLDALSELAIVSFPTKDNFIDGFKRETKWLSVQGDNKSTLSEAMQFTRRPYGLTPYGAAFAGALDLFSGLENSGKARVAVLVTDGEPTDQGPDGVLAKAQNLRDQGVEVITVFVTGAETREARRANHSTMMAGIDASSLNAGKGHWYTANYANFASYSAALIGDANSKSLVERVSDEIAFVENSEALTAVFQNIIKTRAIRCEDR